MDLGAAWSLAVPSAWGWPCWLSAVWLRLRPSVVWERERLPSKEVTLEPEAVRERARRVMLAAGTERGKTHRSKFAHHPLNLHLHNYQTNLYI